MDESFDYYLLLHVQPDAPAPVIKASYRAMMQKLRHHPDLGGDAAFAQRLNEALRVLLDPDLRSHYDRQRRERDGLQNTARAAPVNEAESGPAAQAAEEADSAPGTASARRPPEPPRATAYLPSPQCCPFCQAPRSTRTESRSLYETDRRCYRCGGPATPIASLDPSRVENLRRIYRHEHRAAVELWCRWPLEELALAARLTDLSTAGCALVIPRPLPVDVTVLLKTPALSAICLVRYCRNGEENRTCSLGLEFLTLQIAAGPGTVFSTMA